MDTFSALAEPTRRTILEFLGTRKELSVTQIYDYINKQAPVTPPAISQHLKILRESKLVDVEKRPTTHLHTKSKRTYGTEWMDPQNDPILGRTLRCTG